MLAGVRSTVDGAYGPACAAVDDRSERTSGQAAPPAPRSAARVRRPDRVGPPPSNSGQSGALRPSTAPRAVALDAANDTRPRPIVLSIGFVCRGRVAHLHPARPHRRLDRLTSETIPFIAEPSAGGPLSPHHAGPPESRIRLSRSQRLRQDHHGQGAPRPGIAAPAAGSAISPSSSATRAGSPRARSSVSTASCRVAPPGLAAGDRRRFGHGRPGGARPDPGGHLLQGDAAAAGAARRPPRQPGAGHPRRVPLGPRPRRPARHPDLHPHPARSRCAVFLNSHLLSEVELVCDQVAVISRGRLMASGAIEGRPGPDAMHTGSRVTDECDSAAIRRLVGNDALGELRMPEPVTCWYQSGIISPWP